MLLAIVSDVRLVLVRIAEQLYRLNGQKIEPRANNLAVETREIIPRSQAASAWQFKWELEDLAFRYLERYSHCVSAEWHAVNARPQ
jgi:(p)ppGpp synthase/HD superfamily hydrolase